jgi:NADPH:quinone reductase-like Zn-dependent oxidoreductase
VAQLAGATVIGTASQGTFPFLRELGAQPVTYGAGLADRVRGLAPAGITAAVDMFGTETVKTALALGGDAEPDALPRIADAIAAGQITIPIAARFPIEQIREATALQADRHVHGKIVVTL